MHRRIRLWLLLVGLASVAAIAGCETYTESVSCGMGTVLDEEDDCVAPPPPDGGVEVTTCAELCDLVTGFDADQLACLQGMFGAFGAPPVECTMDLTDLATCNACTAAAGASDMQCATAGSICQ
jgi:hypothetical protein